MLKIFSIIILLFQINFAEANSPQSNIIFKNHRETKDSIHFKRRTFFGRWLFKRRLKKARRFFTKTRRRNFMETLSVNNQKCEEKFLTELNEFAKIDFDAHRKRRSHLYLLRMDNYIDDIALGNLIQYSEYYRHPKSFNTTDRFLKAKNSTPIAKALKIFVTKIRRNECLIPTLRGLTSNSALPRKERKLIKQIKKSGVDKIFYKAIKKLIKKDFHKIRLSNTEYHQRRKTLNRKVNIENMTNPIFMGGSAIFSKVTAGNGTPLRTNLYTNYNDFQIVLMNNIVKKFQKRVNLARRAEISFFDIEGNEFDMLPVTSPAEIYKLCVRILLMEMKLLKANSLFKNKAPTYMDLITSSFELYTVPPKVFDELYKMEELWTPKTSLKEKILFWARTFMGAGSILIPPPYNYLATLSLMIIQTVHRTNQKTATYEHSLFGEF